MTRFPEIGSQAVPDSDDFLDPASWPGLDWDHLAAHHAGLAVGVWTCDDPERIAELVGWGADGVITNVPDVAARVRSCASA